MSKSEIKGDIGFFKLENAGGFVARMEIKWEYEKDGNVASGTYEKDGYHDVCAAAERTIQLNDASNIPDGAVVYLHVKVMLGKGKDSDKYIYKKDSTKTAEYKISGTTLNNSLKLQKYT